MDIHKGADHGKWLLKHWQDASLSVGTADWRPWQAPGPGANIHVVPGMYSLRQSSGSSQIQAVPAACSCGRNSHYMKGLERWHCVLVCLLNEPTENGSTFIFDGIHIWLNTEVTRSFWKHHPVKEVLRRNHLIFVVLSTISLHPLKQRVRRGNKFMFWQLDVRLWV